MITRASIDVDGFERASNYINNKGEHPQLKTNIRYNKIVFNKEELTDKKWLYVGNESTNKIKEHFKTLRHLRLWLK